MVNIVEICRVGDNQATHLINVNTQLGYEVFKFGNKYYIALLTDMVYRG